MEEYINYFVYENYSNKNFLKGNIYEWYCFDYILNKYNSLKIVKQKHGIIDKSIYNYFTYGANGNIVYKIGNNTFCEFDILGISGKEIYLWEITRGKSKYMKNKIIRKKNLLQTIFHNYSVKIFFILPQENIGYKKYNRILVPEPDYAKYFKKGQYNFTNAINSCISLKDFVKHCNNNSLISEIIYLSNKYFDYKIYNRQTFHEEIINKLYDIENINSDYFNNYNIITKKIEKIKYFENSYYINNVELNSIDINIIEEIKKIKFGNVT